MTQKKKEPRVRRSKAEIQNALRSQLALLAKSCREFDEGDRDEIVRIAQALRVILNSNGRDNVSLVAQLGENQARFIDTAARFSETNLLTYAGLIRVRIDVSPDSQTMRPLPVFDNQLGHSRKLVRFADWWNIFPVIRDNTREKFTRRQLVGWMANEDGGSHVDPGLTAAYHRLSRTNALGHVLSIPGSDEIPLLGAVDATIRQIAHEVLRTFQRRHPEWLHGVRYEMYMTSTPPDEPIAASMP
ncbi:hypothetical protein GJG85_09790 [Burkholderia sp. MS389]|uniref:hypothetical protein n=1 Tax=unclassified Burkholderia TaxID=2613784 RepID=UPI0011774461|nr:MULTISPECIES: hypothetical protein [unclassified Burkholderia]QRR13687.1 hypothetical protein GJG85_09790 [Burkholderia sp. MS389]